MRKFLILKTIITMCFAHPDIYNYQQPTVGQYNIPNGYIQSPNANYLPSLVPSNSNFHTSQYNSRSSITGDFNHNEYKSTFLYQKPLHRHVHHNNYHKQHNYLKQNHYQNQRKEPLVTTSFYFHTAPEDYDAPQSKEINFGQPRKHYRVIFIKSPTPPLEYTRISVSQPPVEERTIIYVLTKKLDPNDIHAEFKPSQVPESKPEVFFIKYKTPEEANLAQQEIQAQYDALGGITQVSNEGIASVSSVIGSLGGHADHSDYGYLPLST